MYIGLRDHPLVNPSTRRVFTLALVPEVYRVWCDQVILGSL